MFDFGKKARQEKVKREALEIGARAVENFNQSLTNWRNLSLESRRTMIDNDFAVRLVSLDLIGELSFETVAEIEGLACMKNWIEGIPQYRDEFANFVDEEAIKCLSVIGVEAETNGHIQLQIDEVTAELERDIDLAITEAVKRREEEPRRTGDRNLAERSVAEFGYLESLTVMELMIEARDMANSDPMRSSLVAFMRRFYEIAFFEHGLTNEERNAALSTAQALEADIIASHEDNDDALATFMEAVSLDKQRGRLTGVGSLHWKMEDECVSAGELIAYIARAENATLLPEYLGMLDGDVIAEIRQALLREIVLARQNNGESALEILGPLATDHNPTLAILFEPAEALALRHWNVDRERAQQIVDNLI